MKTGTTYTTNKELRRNQKKPEETEIYEDFIEQNIYKIHIGQVEDGKQCRIVKFTSGSFKERVFMKHKQ